VVGRDVTAVMRARQAAARCPPPRAGRRQSILHSNGLC